VNDSASMDLLVKMVASVHGLNNNHVTSNHAQTGHHGPNMENVQFHVELVLQKEQEHALVVKPVLEAAKVHDDPRQSAMISTVQDGQDGKNIPPAQDHAVVEPEHESESVSMERLACQDVKKVTTVKQWNVTNKIAQDGMNGPNSASALLNAVEDKAHEYDNVCTELQVKLDVLGHQLKALSVMKMNANRGPRGPNTDSAVFHADVVSEPELEYVIMERRATLDAQEMTKNNKSATHNLVRTCLNGVYGGSALNNVEVENREDQENASMVNSERSVVWEMIMKPENVTHKAAENGHHGVHTVHVASHVDQEKKLDSACVLGETQEWMDVKDDPKTKWHVMKVHVHSGLNGAHLEYALKNAMAVPELEHEHVLMDEKELTMVVLEMMSKSKNAIPPNANQTNSETAHNSISCL